MSRTQFTDLNANYASSSSPSNRTIIRARIHNVRAQGAKMAFVTLRQQTTTLQGLVVVNAGGANKELKEGEPVVSKQMLKFVNTIPVGGRGRGHAQASCA